MIYTTRNREEKITSCKNYFIWLKNTIDTLKIDDITNVIELIENAFKNWNKIFVAGNWWSAATASHMASDLQKTTLWKKPQDKTWILKFKAISLSDNIPVMTAWWNDEWFDYIFSEQLKILADKWDLLIVITGSGNSWNIIKILEEAKKIWVKTVWFLWFSWWKAKDLVDNYILVESDNYWFIEDIHMILDHLITSYFKNNII